MRVAAYIFTFLTVLFTLQPLIARCAEQRAATALKACCKKTEKCHSKKAARGSENKGCDKTTGCNPFAGCSGVQYLPVEKTTLKDFIIVIKIVLQPQYAENTIPGYTTDFWQPPELSFI